MSELVMDRRIVWDPRKLREIDEAKAIIMNFKRKGHLILTADNKAMEKFLPSLAEVIIRAQKITHKVMRILCDKGDERVVWDKNDGPEAIQAKDRFKELLNKGFKAYSVDAKGKKNRPIEEFDVDAEEILMIPPTVAG